MATRLKYKRLQVVVDIPEYMVCKFLLLLTLDIAIYLLYVDEVVDVDLIAIKGNLVLGLVDLGTVPDMGLVQLREVDLQVLKDDLALLNTLVDTLVVVRPVGLVDGRQFLSVVLALVDVPVPRDRVEEVLPVQVHHLHRSVVGLRQFLRQEVQVLRDPDRLKHLRTVLVHLNEVRLVHPLLHLTQQANLVCNNMYIPQSGLSAGCTCSNVFIIVFRSWL